MRVPLKYEEGIAPISVLETSEQSQAVKSAKHSLSISVPKETDSQENRIPLTPDAVQLLVNNGNEVIIEAGAGDSAKFLDHEYSDAGAKIVYSAKEAFESSQIILRVNPPTLEEISWMPNNCTVISALSLNQIQVEYIHALNNKRITALAFDLLEDEVGGLPIVRAMSEIAGSTVMLIAAEYLNSINNGRGIILGGITGVPPTKVVILGAGTVAEFAARTAMGLGAEVKVFDNQLYKLRRIKQELGAQIFTSTFDVSNLNDAVKRADVVIGALRAENGRSPCVVTDEMVASMKDNSVIVDVSIDQGGCFETSQETTHANPIYKRYGVIHYCVPNIASRVSHTASYALSNIFTPILLQAQAEGGTEELMFSKDWFMKGVYTFKNSLTAKHIARQLNIRHKDLNLFRLSRL